MLDSHDRDRPTAVLAFPDAPVLLVENEASLRDRLSGLSLVRSGETVVLSRGPKDYVRATRRGAWWSATKRRGGWWTSASFTAGMTTEHSEREARAIRAARSIRKRFALWITSPDPDSALSAAQVETIFVEYFLRKRFSIPYSGA